MVLVKSVLLRLAQVMILCLAVCHGLVEVGTCCKGGRRRVFAAISLRDKGPVRARVISTTSVRVIWPEKANFCLSSGGWWKLGATITCI